MGKNKIFPEHSQERRKKYTECFPKSIQSQSRHEISESNKRSVGDFFIKVDKTDIQDVDPRGGFTRNKNIRNSNKKKNRNFAKSNNISEAEVVGKKYENKNVVNDVQRHNRLSVKTGNKSIKDVVSGVSKKPFDKKKYRLQKYSNKYKVEKWEDERKKAVLREYYRSLKDEPKVDVSQIYKNYDSDPEVSTVNIENENNLNNDNSSHVQTPEVLPQQNLKLRKKPFKRAQEEFQRMKTEKEIKRNEYIQKKADRAEAIKKLKKEKAEKYRKLSRKTKKGQPIMKERMEMLLEKIQKMT